MFKKFEEKENVSGVTQLKSSVQKGIRWADVDVEGKVTTKQQKNLKKKIGGRKWQGGKGEGWL